MLTALRAHRRTARRIKLALGDRRGVAAVEFAIVAPIMILMLLGVADVVPAVTAKFKAGHGAQATAQVVATYTQMQATDMANIYASTADVMAPLPTGTLAVRISNIYSNGKGQAYVYWSCGQGALPAYTARSAVTTTPTGTALGSLLWMSTLYNVNAVNTSMVQVETQYTYSPVMQFLLTTPLAMSNVAYEMPRTSSYVGFPWTGSTSTYPTAPASTTKTASVTLSNGAVCSYAA